MMSRWRSIVYATALEILSEPLSLLILLAALALAVLAPAFHYHQFGEATRMARDAGLSSLLLGTLAFAAFGTVRAMRREMESGTFEMVMAHPVSCAMFFVSKLIGVLVALVLIAVTLTLTTLILVRGAEIGGVIAERTGDIARIWGVSLACGISVILLPLMIGAVLNRFFHFRFVLTALLGAFIVAICGSCYAFSLSLACAFLPVAFLTILPSIGVIAIAGALSVRFRASAALIGVALALGAFLPALGNYYLADNLSRGGSVAWRYVALAVLAILPCILAFVFIGIRYLNHHE